MTITVRPVNNAPQAMADTYVIDENMLLQVDADAGVLTNDSDVDGDPLTVSKRDDPANGFLSLSENGSFFYLPDNFFVGSDQFSYVASDGQFTSEEVTVSITVVGAAAAMIDVSADAEGDILVVRDVKVLLSKVANEGQGEPDLDSVDNVFAVVMDDWRL